MDTFLDQYLVACNIVQSLDELRVELLRFSNERNVIIYWMEEQRKLVGTRVQYLLGPDEKLVNKIQKYDQYLLQAKNQVEQIDQDAKETTGELVVFEHKWKQVMISSHNEDFVSLIKNKSALEAYKIGFIHFKSYSRDQIDLDTDCICVS